MHERDALTKRSVKHSLALFYFHFDAHRLEPNLVNLRFRHHLGVVVFVIGQRGRSGVPPSGNGAAEGATIRLLCSVTRIDLEALSIIGHRDLTLDRRERPESAERAAKLVAAHIVERPHVLGLKAQMRLRDEGLAVRPNES